MAKSLPGDSREAADRLHSAAIHLLRGVRQVDRETGLSAARLSVLSILVFDGPQTVSMLAEAEQVALPTMSRLLKDMEFAGLVKRTRSRMDARIQILSVTARGRRILEAGRARRVASLLAAVDELRPAERKALSRLLPVIEKLAAAVRNPGR